MRRFFAFGAVVFTLATAISGTRAEHSEAQLFITWLGRDGEKQKELTLSRRDLQALPQVSFRTRTFWTDGVHAFTGPSLFDIAALGPGTAVTATITGLDGYASDLIAYEWKQLGAILAVWCDGEPMAIRDKGPYWVMFPADSNPEVLFTKEIQEKLVWHVNRIEFRLDR